MDSQVSTIGLVIYTYSPIEGNASEIWTWITKVEEWAKSQVAEFSFSSHNKESNRIWKSTAKNRQALYTSLQTDQPWSEVILGYPRNIIKGGSTIDNSWCIYIGSRSSASSSTLYKSPSYIFLEFSSKLLHESSESISEFLDICIEIWDIWKGAYGFIDIKESSPLKDDLFRNAIHLLDDTIPEPLVPEFKAWVDIKYTLNRHIWKAFWGNFLCFEHICYLGEKAISRNKPTHTANFPRTADYFYQIGIQELQQCACVHTLQVLKNRGVLLAISQSPMQWFQSDTQKDLAKLQDTLTPISINWQ